MILEYEIMLETEPVSLLFGLTIATDEELEGSVAHSIIHPRDVLTREN